MDTQNWSYELLHHSFIGTNIFATPILDPLPLRYHIMTYHIMYTHIINIHILSYAFYVFPRPLLSHQKRVVPTQKIREVKGYDFLQALPVDGVLEA